jgi:hypothetical protein
MHTISCMINDNAKVNAEIFFIRMWVCVWKENFYPLSIAISFIAQIYFSSTSSLLLLQWEMKKILEIINEVLFFFFLPHCPNFASFIHERGSEREKEIWNFVDVKMYQQSCVSSERISEPFNQFSCLRNGSAHTKLAKVTHAVNILPHAHIGISHWNEREVNCN